MYKLTYEYTFMTFQTWKHKDVFRLCQGPLNVLDIYAYPLKSPPKKREDPKNRGLSKTPIYALFSALKGYKQKRQDN